MYAFAPAIAKPEMDPLERERREIERRRARYEDRKTRILHAKTRIIGIDTETLNEQVKEKQDKQKDEYMREQLYDEMTLTHARQLTAAEQERAKEERRRAEELNFYRQQQNMDKKARDQMEKTVSDNLEGEATLLQFAGQDIDFGTRTRMQQSQQKEWLTQQIDILKDKEARERADDQAYASTQATITEKIAEQEAIQYHTKRMNNKQLYEYNQLQAREKREREQREKALENSQDQKELVDQLSSTFLNEATEESAFGSHRTIPYGFKGFTTSQRQQILDEQFKQAQESRARKEREREEELKYAQQQEEFRRTALKLERERSYNEQMKRHSLKFDRQQQAHESSIRHQHLNQVVYTNPVSEDYFKQFGTSHR